MDGSTGKQLVCFSMTRLALRLCPLIDSAFYCSAWQYRHPRCRHRARR
jgi:hypothetical protein